ncbi:MAG: serine/threonine-protein kinase [Kofleriaceae bacterium]|nr:serine/threonine-protein kinase [Kofleriaceae bacterium]
MSRLITATGRRSARAWVTPNNRAITASHRAATALDIPVLYAASPAVPSMEEPVQKSLERYDVLDRIAVGGMAEVFLAKAYGAHGFEKTIAIKRILPELASDPEFAARFIAEAKVAVRLSHANIVQVFDFGRIGESLFIAMEYVDGLDLAAMLRKFKDEGRQVPLPAAFHIAIEIMRALDFAHGHNVVHRDVSPSNILVSRAGEVKIADFGIAVAARPHTGSTSTGPRKVMGKWRYMSPEQTRGDQLDTRSDLFSAASVLFELFTGQKLFPGDEAEDIAKNIESMPIPRMQTLRSNLPSRLDDVLAGPLSRKPIDRPTRPATVLRSLIELSYESSIMATALDVAEALATVIPAKRQEGRGALDDVIRKQLNDPPTAARRTAVTDGKPPATETQGEVSTGLFRKLDVDGLSRLEEVDTKIAAPRARRNSTELPVMEMPGDTGAVDKDRRTEVGGPPTGTIPKYSALGDEPDDQVSDKDSAKKQRTETSKSGARAAAKPVAQDAPPAKSRALLAMLGLLVLGGGAAAVYALTRGGEETPQVVVTPPSIDAAAVEVTTGTLEIYTTPPGATGTIAGRPIGGRTPQRISNVPAGKVKIHLELEGYLPIDYEIEVRAGEVLRDRPTFVAAPALLDVKTEPTGVQVAIAGRTVGTTPFAGKALPADKGVTITLSRAGYESLSFKIDLEAGKTLAIERTLKQAQKFAAAQIKFDAPGWGYVYLDGKKLGQAPLKQVMLPVGKVRLKLVNDVAKVEWFLECDVREDAANICVTRMPSP